VHLSKGDFMSEEKKLYVGNLEYSINDEELKNAFTAKGIAVKEVKIIMDKFSGKSKGFGFVELDDSVDVQQAIDTMDSQEVKGRKLKVNKANKPRPKN
jgi:RNA recognition motif-containing protein